MKRKYIIILGIIVLTGITFMFTSYGFFNTKIFGNNTSKLSTFKNNPLSITYSDSTNEIVGDASDSFTPGSTITKTFSITNPGETSFDFGIILDNITNTFTRTQDITYTVTLDGVELINDVFPTSKKTIIYNQNIEPNETLNYVLTIKYLSSEENQIADSGATIGAKLVFDYGHGIDNLLIYGNSVQNGTPTPTNPIEIQSVGNYSRNLLGNWEKGWIYVDGTYNGDLDRRISDYVKLENKKYTISGVTNNYSIVHLYDSSKERVESYTYGDHKVRVIDNTNNTYSYLRLGVPSTSYEGVGMYEGEFNGATVPKYEPFGKYIVPISITGKNLITELNSGFPNNNTFPNLTTTTSTVYKTATLNNVKAGTYTCSFEKKVNIIRTMATSSYASNYSIPITSTLNTKATSFTLTQDEDIFMISFRDAASNSTPWEGWVQCEKGDTQTEYEPYSVVNTYIYLDEPLRKVGDYVDYIDIKNKKVVRNVASKELSTLNWVQNYENKRFYTSSLTSKIVLPTDNWSNSILLTNYKSIIWDSQKDVFVSYYKNGYIYIKDSNYADNTLTTFKNDLNGQYIHYPIKTPIEESITVPNLSVYSKIEDVRIGTSIEPSNVEININ